MPTRDPLPSNETGNPACCSPITIEVFYHELRTLPEPLYRRTLASIGELARSHPRLCHRRLFLLALFMIVTSQPIDDATPWT